MVARTLPGKQFEVGRQLRVLVVAALIRAGIVSSADSTPVINTIPSPAAAAGSAKDPQDGEGGR
jgi:small conductance mechanosensitive channel